MTRKFYEVPKRILLIIAGIIWMIAGFNVVRLGIISYGLIEMKWYLPVLSVVIFGVFGMMFYKMTQKHGKRIKGYEEDYRPVWNFFDIKSYIIMAVMMGGGIGLRNVGIFPDIFVAFFYTGLGCALFLAGVCFVVMFFRKQNVILTPHMAFYTEQSTSDMVRTTMLGLRSFESGEASDVVIRELE